MISVVLPSSFIDSFIVAYPLATVYRARTEPQVRCYVHGCDNISNVTFVSRLRLVNGTCDHKPATLVVGH